VCRGERRQDLPQPRRRKTWMWFLQSPIGARGYADDIEEAKDALKKRCVAETERLRRKPEDAEVDQLSKGERQDSTT